MIKLYDRTPVNVSDDHEYMEYAFTEYRPDGTIYRHGTEDFTRKRARDIQGYQIWTWNGLSRWKNGYRAFEYRRTIYFNRKDHSPAEVRKMFENPYFEVRLKKI